MYQSPAVMAYIVMAFIVMATGVHVSQSCSLSLSEHERLLEHIANATHALYLANVKAAAENGKDIGVSFDSGMPSNMCLVSFDSGMPSNMCLGITVQFENVFRQVFGHVFRHMCRVFKTCA